MALQSEINQLFFASESTSYRLTYLPKKSRNWRGKEVERLRHAFDIRSLAGLFPNGQLMLADKYNWDDLEEQGLMVTCVSTSYGLIELRSPWSKRFFRRFNPRRLPDLRTKDGKRYLRLLDRLEKLAAHQVMDGKWADAKQ